MGTSHFPSCSGTIDKKISFSKSLEMTGKTPVGVSLIIGGGDFSIVDDVGS